MKNVIIADEVNHIIIQLQPETWSTLPQVIIPSYFPIFRLHFIIGCTFNYITTKKLIGTSLLHH